MPANIVVFGVTHSGKSTLCGYLWSLMEKNKRISENYNQKLKNELGNDYDPSRYYGYLVDDSKEEIPRKPDAYGTSKKTHYRKIVFEDTEITIIDAPGSPKLIKEIKRGMFYADIGVFFIEIMEVFTQNFLNLGQYDEILQMLKLWALFKKNVIVVLSKADLLPDDFSAIQYKKIQDEINNIFSLDYDYTKIVPISIDVPKKTSKNVLDNDANFVWYRGDSLYKIITNEIAFMRYKNDDNLLFYVDQMYFHKGTEGNKGTGKTWRIKILSGQIRVGDEIILSPVFLGKANDKKKLKQTEKTPTMVRAKVTSIHYNISRGEEKVNLESAGRGNIVGITFHSVVNDNEGSINKREIHTLKTTCGFSCKKNFKSSNIIKLKMEEIFDENKFRNDEHLNIMFFARMISVRVKEIEVGEKALTVEILSSSKQITLPIEDGGFILCKVRVFHKNDFLSAQIVDLIEATDN